MRTLPVTGPPRPLRILEVVDTLDAGGMERQLVALMNRLDPEKFTLEVCCLRHPGVHASWLNPGHLLHSLRKPEGFQPGTVVHLHRVLRRGFDLVHTHNLGTLIYAALATLGGRTCPIFHGEHSQFTPAEAKPGRIWLRRLLYRSCKAVHTVSARQCEELVRAQISHPAMFPLLNGVNMAEFIPAKDAHEKSALRRAHGIPWPEALLCGIIGRFGPFKRHLELIQAFEEVAESHPRSRLVIVGDGGPAKEAVLARMSSSVHAAKMHWCGHQQDTAPFFRMLDLLVVPSSNEGLSNVTLEALASGVPVLSNDVCGAAELIPSEEGGWVKDLSTVSRLAAALRHIMDLPPGALSAMGCRGRQNVERKFSWDAMTQRYTTCFQRLAGGSSLAGRDALCGDLNDI